ncbi:MAG: hypothetical protein CMJ18_17415 [Phycisphaeraceae bacterium]|nr:hypothetical protein [Phycisphaeraceae bacterium]
MFPVLTASANAPIEQLYVEIHGNVTESGGLFDYSYEIVVSSAPIGDPTSNFIIGDLGVSAFSIPLFDDPDVAIVNGASGLIAPLGWSGAVLPGAGHWSYDPATDPFSGTYGVDPLGFVAPPLVVQFAADSTDDYVQVDTALSGFGFTSPFGSGDGPALVQVASTNPDLRDPVTSIDPPYIASPHSPHGVPEPVTAGLAGMGVAALGAYLKRRRC